MLVSEAFRFRLWHCMEGELDASRARRVEKSTLEVSWKNGCEAGRRHPRLKARMHCQFVLEPTGFVDCAHIWPCDATAEDMIKPLIYLYD